MKTNCKWCSACVKKVRHNYAYVLLLGEVTGKHVTGTLKVLKKINYEEKRFQRYSIKIGLIH